jgi:hypothetical protein
MTYLDAPKPPGRYGWRIEILGRAEFHGWHVRMFGADWGPDLLLIRRPRLLWVFAEPERGRLSAARLASLAELRACHQVAVVMRPSRARLNPWPPSPPIDRRRIGWPRITPAGPCPGAPRRSGRGSCL